MTIAIQNPVYLEILKLQGLGKGLSPSAKGKLCVLINQLLENEKAIEKGWCCWDCAAEQYHVRTELLAMGYDLAHKWAH